MSDSTEHHLPDTREPAQEDSQHYAQPHAQQRERDEPTDALWSRLRLIEGQPLADRADAYMAVHDELSRKLDSGPRGAGDDTA
ncbi:hypothetical protein [Microbacterium sp. YY-01]|uniref:hypothetical protein n=1 Tax=Microbacterium sp. YY-01 TaxID=3421634 RepID=UPI003D1672E7